MNVFFLPNESENKLIQIVQKYCRNDFALIRMTDTMLDKSIIDASETIRLVFRDYSLVDYRTIMQGQQYKQLRPSVVISSQGIIENRASFYRPPTKNGDPRFWIYGFSSIVNSRELIYFTVHESKIIAIPLTYHPDFEMNLASFFGTNDEDIAIIEELKNLMRDIKAQGWIESVSPYKSAPKDVGDTLERELGIEVNNLVSADFKGKIEIKAKREGAGTLDTLFSMVPNWDISEEKSSTDVMLKYGYPSRKYEGFVDLYVNVNHRPNNQGLYLLIDDENELIRQMSFIDGVEKDVGCWRFSEIKQRLYEKHPKTLWVVAEEDKFEGKIHFRYTKIQLTERPIFTQFLSLIEQGVVIYNWRGRVKPDRTSYKDKGHCFRITPSKRSLLFGETTDLEL